jgi:hypothetical protein
MEDLKMNRYGKLVALSVLCALGAQNIAAWPSLWPSSVQTPRPVQIIQPTQPSVPMLVVVQNSTAHEASSAELFQAATKKAAQETANAVKSVASILGLFYFGRQYQLVKCQGIGSLWDDKDGVFRAVWTYSPAICLSVLSVGALYGAYKTGFLGKVYRSMTRPAQQVPAQ